MNTKAALLVSLMACAPALFSQSVSRVYKIDELVKRIDTTQAPLVVNFWATWCKPCIQELPAFDSLSASAKNVKVILVCIDFKEDLDTKVNPFLKKHAIKSECVLLDEVNGNDFINKISADWSGAIPATLFKSSARRKLVEKKMHLRQLEEQVNSPN